MFTNVEIQQSQELRSSVWAEFKMKYPNADLSRFAVNVYFNKNKASTEIFLKNSNAVETSVSSSDRRRYWSHELKTALGI